MISIAKPLLGQAEQDAVAAVLASGNLAHGAVTEAFEAEFAQFAGTRHAMAVSNGTAALHLSLEAAGVGPGDEVITTPFTFVATANAILMTGAKPVFADIDPVTFNLDPAAAAAAVTPKTKAIMPVHLYGLAADLDPLCELAAERDLALVEDAAQAHGAAYKGRHVGGFGVSGCFSLYPTKNMTSGEGGVITTNDESFADLVRSLRNHGRGKTELGTYDHVRFGYNLRSTDIASAIARAQLERLPGFNEARRANAARLGELLADVPALVLPVEPDGYRHVYHQFTIRVPDRDGVQARLREAGVGSGVYYPKTMYQYEHLAGFARACPEAERAVTEALSLPVHPDLSAEDIEKVARAVRAAVA